MINAERFIHPHKLLCTLYYFCFLSSRVVQLTPYFMILLALIFIVNWNFKLLNWHNILWCYYRLCCCQMRYPVVFLLCYYYLCYCCPLIIIICLLLLLFTHSLIYLFIYFVVLTWSWSPHKIYYIECYMPLNFVKWNL